MLFHLGRRLVLQGWRGRLCVGKWSGRAPLRASCVLGPGGGRTVSGWHQWLQWSAMTRQSFWSYYCRLKQAVYAAGRSMPRIKGNSHVLLCGMAAFMWDREKISNQEILRCLKQYEDRVKSQLQTSEDVNPRTTDRRRAFFTSSWERQLADRPRQSCSSNEDNFLNKSSVCSDQKTGLSKQESKMEQCVREAKEHSREYLSRLPLVGLRPAGRAIAVSLQIVDLFHAVRVFVFSEISHLRQITRDKSFIQAFTDVSAQQSQFGILYFMKESELEHENHATLQSHISSDFPLKYRDSNPVSNFFQTVHKFTHAKTVHFSHENFSPASRLLPESITEDKMANELVEHFSSILNSLQFSVLEQLTSLANASSVTLSLSGVPVEVVSEDQRKGDSQQEGDGMLGQDRKAVLSDWELLAKEGNCTVYRKPYQDTELFQFKVIGRYDDITAKDYFDVQVDNELRKSWDSFALKLETVDSDPRTRSDVIHWVMKYPFPMSSREYVFMRRSWISAEEDAIVLVNKLVEHPSVPEGRKYVRVRSYFSEMVIRPHSFSDELGFDFELTYFDDPQINLPSSCVNWVTTTAMPDFLGKIHTAALKRANESHKKQVMGA